MTNFIYVKSFFVTLLSSSNDTSVDIVDDESSFEFSPKAEFTSPLYVYITPTIDTDAPCSRQRHTLRSEIIFGN